MLGLSTSSSPGTKPMRSIINAGRKLWLKFRRSDNIGRERVSGGGFDGGLIGTIANSGGAVYTWALNTVAPISGTQDGLLSITSVGTDASHPRLKFDGNLILDKSFVLTFDYKVNSGTCEFSSINRGGGGSLNFPTVTLTGSGTYTFYFQGTGTGDITINFDGTNLFEIQFDNISIKEISQFELDASSESNDAKLFTGKALSFDGTNDYVELPAGIGLEGAFTIAVWVFLDSYTTPVIVGDATNEDWLRFGSDGTDFTVKIAGISSGSLDVVYGGTMPLSKWTRVVLIRDADGVISMALDGVLYTDETGLSSRTFDFDIIGRKDTQYVNGQFSDLQVYDSAWTANDAYLDYTYPNELLIDAGGSVARNSLRVHLPMSEGSGAVAFNSVRLGEELITNGNFTDLPLGADWGLGGGWSVGDGVVTAASAGAAPISQVISGLTAGSTYKVKFEVTAVTQGYVRVYAYVGASGSFSNIFSSPTLQTGEYEVDFVFGGTNKTLRFYGSTGAAPDFAGSITNISVREIVTPFDSIYNGAALGATWVTAQPTIPQLGMQDWSKGSNLFPTSESISTLHNVTSSAVEGPAINSADALNTATRLTENAANSQHYGAPVFVAYNGIEYTFSVFVKKGNYDAITIFSQSAAISSNVVFTFSTESFSSATYNPAAEDYGNGWYRVSWTATANTDFGASMNCSLYLCPLSLNTYVGDTSKYTDFFGWQVEIGDTMGNYIPTNGLLAQDATLTANPYNAGYDVVGNALRTRNKGLNLNGIGYAEIADDDTLDFGTGDFTMECWVKYKFENTGSAVNCIIALGGDAANASASLLTSSTTFRVYVGSGFVNSTYTLVEDNWYHVVGTRTGTTIRLYINGEVESSTGTSNQSLTNALVKFVGVDTNTTTRTYKSAINEVRVYNRALSLTEITNNYKVGKSKHSN